MDNQYYKNQLPKLEELRNQANDKKETFLQQILILASGILAILVSLHDIPSGEECIRWVFAVALVLLLFGILTIGIALFLHTKYKEEAVQMFAEELENAQNEDRKVGMVSGSDGKVALFFEKFAYTCLILSLILLVVYAIVLAFSEGSQTYCTLLA